MKLSEEIEQSIRRDKMFAIFFVGLGVGLILLGVWLRDFVIMLGGVIEMFVVWNLKRILKDRKKLLEEVRKQEKEVK